MFHGKKHINMALTIQEQICQQEELKFNGYRGRMNKPFRNLHLSIRSSIGDEEYLEYLNGIPEPPKFIPNPLISDLLTKKTNDHVTYKRRDN